MQKNLINSLSLAKEDLETIQKLSALNYTKSQIALYLDIDLDDFVLASSFPESIINFYIDKGKLESDFLINSKLADNAEGGNITAIQELNKMKTAIYIEQIKARILYGED